MPDITFPPVDVNKAAADFNHAFKEGAYVAVGLGVLGFQRAQVQRVELVKQLEAQFGQLSAQFEGYTESARSQAELARHQLAEQFSELSERLEEVLAPAWAQLGKALPSELPKFPDFGEPLNAAGQTLDEQQETARVQLTELARAVDERMQPVRQQLDEQIDRLEQTLPAAARNVVQSVRAAAATPEQVLRTAVGLD
ncbi:MAG TPA: hypothetical protein VGL49_06605 [Acidimicrobiales bacterium]